MSCDYFKVFCKLLCVFLSKLWHESFRLYVLVCCRVFVCPYMLSCVCMSVYICYRVFVCPYTLSCVCMSVYAIVCLFVRVYKVEGIELGLYSLK